VQVPDCWEPAQVQELQQHAARVCEHQMYVVRERGLRAAAAAAVAAELLPKVLHLCCSCAAAVVATCGSWLVLSAACVLQQL
jgi:hypothetical protein